MKKLYSLSIKAAILFLFFLNNSFAQLNYMSGGFSSSGGTYVDLGTNGNPVTMSNIDNGRSEPLSIGFPFNFNGATYDSFVMYVDGFIKLGRDTASGNLLFTSFVQPPAGGPFNSTDPKDTSLIVPFGQDLWNRNGLQNSEFRVFTTGSLGSRVCTIQWKNVSDKLQNGVDPQFDTINFQVKLHEGSNWIEFIYGRWVPSTFTSNARFGACGLKGRSTLANQIITLTKASAVAWSNVIVNSGNYTTNALNYGNNVGINRPAPDIGRIYRFTPVVLNDLAVNLVYSIGKVIANATATDSVRAFITNPGVNPQTNATVTMTVGGANAGIYTATIPFIASNGSVYVSFPPVNATNFGASVVNISLPFDDNLSNNQGNYGLSVSNSRLSYTDTLQNPGQSYGHANWVQFWGSRFRITDKRRITQVRTFVFSNSGALGDTIRGMVIDTLGNILGLSTPYIIQNTDLGNWVNLNFPIPVNINNNAFISGVACQAASVNRFLGSIQNESPIRPNNNLFYSMSNFTTAVSSLTTGIQFANPAIFALGRLMIECSAEPNPANDYGVVASFPQNNLTVATGRNIPLRALVRNLGNVTQSAGVPVRYRINNGAIIGPVNTAISLTSDDTTMVTFTGTSSLFFTTPGIYTLKIWTGLGADAARYNDTLEVRLNVVSTGLNIPYRAPGDFNANNWVTQSSNTNLVKSVLVTNPNGQTVNAILLENFNFFGSANLISPMLSFTGITRPVLHFHVAHAPSLFTSVSDTLQVLISTNNGYTFNTVYSKTGQGAAPRLGTVAASGSFYSPANASEWRQEFVDLSAYANLPNIVVAFRNISQTGNNIYLSNVNVTNPNNVFNTTLFSAGLVPNNNIIVIFNSIGAPNTDFTISTYNGFPTSVASPVFLNNATAPSPGNSIFTPSNVGNRLWTLNYAGIGTGNLPSSVSYTVNIDYAGLGGINNGDSVYIMRRSDHSGSWVALPTTRSGNVLTSSAINNGFAEFALGSNPANNSLPVSLIAFDGFKKDNDVYLNWLTANEINNKGFEILKSNDGVSFTNIGFVKGKGTSGNINNYSFIDNSPFSETGKIYYQLKQIDFDGTEYLSQIIVVNNNEPFIYNIAAISPNPFIQDFQIDVHSAQSQNIDVELIDMNGKVIFIAQKNISAGLNQILFNIGSEIKSGIYSLKIKIAGDTKVCKMLKM